MTLRNYKDQKVHKVMLSLKEICNTVAKYVKDKTIILCGSDKKSDINSLLNSSLKFLSHFIMSWRLDGKINQKIKGAIHLLIRKPDKYIYPLNPKFKSP